MNEPTPERASTVNVKPIQIISKVRAIETYLDTDVNLKKMKATSDVWSVLEKRSHPRKGHALYAKQPFSAGQPIAQFTPTILLPQTSHLEVLCTHCLSQPPAGTRACTRCQAAFYCGSQCQSLHWKAVHSKECKPLGRVAEKEGKGKLLPTLVRAALQAAVKDDIGKKLEGLEGHTARWMQTARWKGKGVEVAAKAVMMYSGREDMSPDMAAGIISKIQTNAFHRYDPDLGQYAVFLEPNLAMVNHSCLPNAVVQFMGRDAVLRAETPIAAGDEIEISYTDNIQPLSVRRHELADYFFECQCKRCAEDLNVYQVCAESPNLALNRESLAPDLHLVKQHPAATAGKTKLDRIRKLTNAVIEKADDGVYADMMEEKLWAIPGIAEAINLEMVSRIEAGKIPEALALACHQATQCDPYRYPAPFHPQRTKALLVIAKLLSNTAAETAALNNSISTLNGQGSAEQKMQEGLGDIDQVSLCQMILILILRWAPKGYEAEWELSIQAKVLLDDIDKLPGREKELSLINAWKDDPLSEASQAFFDFAVVKPVNALAALGRSTLDFEANPDPA